MKDPVRRDTLLTIIGLSLIAAVFIFAVYRPMQKACSEAQREIAAADQSIRDIPLRLAELKSLEDEIRLREEYLQQHHQLIPENADLHSVLRQVTNLARNSNLSVSRLEPMPPVEYESYRVVPFRVSFTGDFRGVATFAKGLESCGRLFSIEEIALNAADDKRPLGTSGDMYFSVYARRAEISDSTENNTSQGQPGADNKG
jgi:Tfp pilus assembly protein PilO